MGENVESFIPNNAANLGWSDVVGARFVECELRNYVEHPAPERVWLH